MPSRPPDLRQHTQSAPGDAKSALPIIIQGGMGVAVSAWRLAHAVSELGQLGVVSGTALDQVFARRLQDGDVGGHMRHGLDHFPFQEMAERVWNAYFISEGKPGYTSYKRLPMHDLNGPRELQELSIVANFVEMFLAREGHANPVGINYLEKIQLPLLASAYGAMLAGVDYVLMGAGIPLKVPGVLDGLSRHEAVTYPLYVTGAPGAHDGDDTTIRFDPRDFMEFSMAPLKRPKFLAIIASNTLALTMVKKANGKVDGFVVEGPTAGGHNAPPRGKLQLNEAGEPIYGERDVVDLEKLKELHLPFWLAGGYGNPRKVQEALAAGAAGVQVGTAFAFCEESGLREEYRQAVLQRVAAGTVHVATDPLASPTGFPFKVAQVAGSNSDAEIFQSRPRICDLGYLREAYRTEEGTVGYRCAGEPVTTYVAKGGKIENTIGRKCLCNGLMANVGYAQVRAGNRIELGLITSGDDVGELAQVFPEDGIVYTAADVVNRLLLGS